MVTYDTTLSTLTRGNGLTGSNYDGSAAQTFAVDFGTGTNQAARGDHTHTNMVTGTGTATRVAFWNSASTIASNANLYWDNTNSRLGIGTAAPAYALEVTGTGRVGGLLTLGTQATGTGHAVRADRTITAGTGLTGGGNLTANRTISLDKSHTNCNFTAVTTLNAGAQDTTCAAGFCAVAAVNDTDGTTRASAKYDGASLYFNAGVEQFTALKVLCCPCQ
jgi:hypothetical protein